MSKEEAEGILWFRGAVRRKTAFFEDTVLIRETKPTHLH